MKKGRKEEEREQRTGTINKKNSGPLECAMQWGVLPCVVRECAVESPCSLSRLFSECERCVLLSLSLPPAGLTPPIGPPTL